MKQVKLDYSEIFVTEMPKTSNDPMGVGVYWVAGDIIGKKRLNETSSWNLIFKVNNWNEDDIFKAWFWRGLIILQIFFLILFSKKYFISNKQKKHVQKINN